MPKLEEVSGCIESLKITSGASPHEACDGVRFASSPRFVFNSCFLSFRSGSVGQPFQGAYLEISENPKYKKLTDAVDEKIIIAEVVNKINRANGKVTKWI